MVVGLATAGGGEAVAVVKAAGGKVGFAEFEEDAGDRGAAELVHSGEEERRGCAFAAKIRMDGNIEDFCFVGSLTGGQEANGLATCLAHENKAAA